MAVAFSIVTDSDCKMYAKSLGYICELEKLPRLRELINTQIGLHCQS